MSNSQPAPLRAPINRAGPVSAEWWRYFQQLQTAGATLDQHTSTLATHATQIAALQTQVADQAITLETNGAPNANQNKLNLVAGANVTLASDAKGGVTITAASVPAAVRETPAGALDGNNTTFLLSAVPNPAASLTVYRNGIEQDQTRWCSVSGQTITFAVAPKPTDKLIAEYTH